MTRDATLILIAGGFLAAGAAASLLAARLRLPALVLFLGLGMAIGSDGADWIDFEDYEVARLVGSVALAVILFEGGLASGFSSLRPVLTTAVSLALVGTLLTAAVTGLAAVALFDVSLLEGVLIGAILSPTDGAAVFAVLGSMKLPPRVAHTLKGEAGLNDPIAVLLVLGTIELITAPGYGALDLVAFFAQELAIGAVVGIVVGWLAARALERAGNAQAGVVLVGAFAAAAVSYGAAGALHGSGFLAAYLAGLCMAGARLPARKSVLAFHNGLASVAELGLFLTLGLLVFPSELGEVAVPGIVLAAVVAFLARPLAAALATAGQGFSAQERVVIGWAGLRGAVPVVLATFAVIAEVPRSEEFFNIAFFAVLLSTAVQGSTLEWLAGRLGLAGDRRTDTRRSPGNGALARRE